MNCDIVIRNVEIDGHRGLDIGIKHGRIAEIGRGLARGADERNGHGGALIPGLADHHIHLLALAAEAQSLILDTATSAATFEKVLRSRLVALPEGVWLRVTGYHEAMAGEIERAQLDTLAPRHPIRIQHQSGILWILNSRALDALNAKSAEDPSIERNREGEPTGRIWRGDSWLRAVLPPQIPDLAPVGARLTSWGLTAVTDASASTDNSTASLLDAARRRGALPMQIMLMSAGPLALPCDSLLTVGPVKILLDDHDLLPLDALVSRMRDARKWGRQIAVHCVTAVQLALALAALNAVGARAGDRIEHGSVIPKEAIAEFRRQHLTVVTQPSFVSERGDRYIDEVDPLQLDDLYRCASLRQAAVPLAAGSDAPYASPNPWLSIRAAIDRRTRSGAILGAAERISPDQALALYLGEPERPGFVQRKVRRNTPADLCLLRAPLSAVLGEPSADFVRCTIIGGHLCYEAKA
jgi:predicted amidohydrolase YtcJ